MSDTVFFTQTAPQVSLARTAGLGILTLARAAGVVVSEWRRRSRSRMELASYSYDKRNDLGFAAEVDAEIAKSFWQK